MSERANQRAIKDVRPITIPPSLSLGKDIDWILKAWKMLGLMWVSSGRQVLDYSLNKKVQQSWQTSALAMHLPLARLISMPVIFCLLSSSSIVILVFYLFSTGISEQHVWELWVWIQSTGLTLPLRVTPMNNPITLITSIVTGVHFCCDDSYMRSSANFRIVFSESQNTSPLDAELGPDFNAKWPFKVIRFGVNEEPLRGYIVQYNNCGLECIGSEDIVSERSEIAIYDHPTLIWRPLSSKPPRIST